MLNDLKTLGTYMTSELQENADVYGSSWNEDAQQAAIYNHERREVEQFEWPSPAQKNSSTYAHQRKDDKTTMIYCTNQLPLRHELIIPADSEMTIR